MKTAQSPSREALKAFETVPDLYLILSPDLVILTASDTYLAATFTRRATIVGRYLFDVFPDNPDYPGANGVKNLKASLQMVLETRQPHRMTLQRYDVPRPGGPGFITKQWRPLNTPVLGEGGEVLYIIHKAEDVSWLDRAEAEIREEHRRMRDAQAIGKIGSFEWNLGEEQVAWSDQMYYLNGMDPQSEVITIEKTNALIHPEDYPRVHELKEISFRTPGHYQLEHRIVLRDGTIKHVNHRFESLADDTGRIVRVSGTVQDITERKRAEGEILRLKDEITQKATDKYLSLFNAMEEGFVLIELIRNEEGRWVNYKYLEANPAFEKQVGLNSEDIIGKNVLDLFPTPDDWWAQTFGEVLDKKESKQFEHYLKGNDRWYEVFAYPMGDAQVAVLYNNITERKKAETALRESEERKSYLLRLSDALHSLSNAVEIQKTVTYAAMNYFTADRCYYGEIDGDTVTIRRDAARPGLPSVAASYSLNQMPVFKAVLQHNHPVVVPDVTGSALVDDNLKQLCREANIIAYINVPVVRNGQLVGIFCVTQGAPREWTEFEVKLAEEVAERTWSAVERAKAEEALQDSEKRFRAAFEQANVGIVQASIDGRILFPNPGFCQIIGYREAEAKTLTVRDITHPDDYEGDMEQAQRVVNGEMGGYSMEKRYVRKDGTIVWVQLSSTMVRDAAGEPFYALAIVEDITARKQAEEALQQANERFRIAEEASNGFVYDWEVATGRAVRSNGFNRVLGYAPGEIPETAAAWIDLIHPDDLSVVEAFSPGLLNTQHTLSTEYRVRDRNGNYHHVLDRSLLLRDPEGNVVRMVGSTVDITERKQAEEALRQSEERFRLATSAARIYAWQLDLTTQKIIYSENAHALLGYERLPETLSPGYQTIHPDDQARVGQAVTGALRSGGKFEIEYRYLSPTRGVVWLASTGVIVSGPDGQPQSLVGIGQDITERKRAQEDLRESDERLRAMIKHMPGAAAFIVDRDLRYLLAEGEALYTAGLTPEDLVGKTIFEALPPEIATPYESIYRQALAGEAFVFEHEAHGGSYISHGTPLRSARGEIYAVLAVSYDITLRKQAEEQLKTFNARLEAEVSARTAEVQKSAALLQSVFDAAPNSIVVLQILPAEEGQADDFRILAFNAFTLRTTGRRQEEVAGATYGELFPTSHTTGLFEQLRKVAQTGVPAEIEYWYEGEGIHHWFYSRITRLDGLLVITTEDITARKNAEAEITKNLTLLRQSEQVAKMGSWDYDVNTGIFNWSEGMYHLFGLPVGSPVGIEIYLAYAIEEDRPIAERIVHTLYTEPGPLEETLRIAVNGEVFTLKIKATVLRDEAGQPVRILGVDLDISEIKRLEQENLRMRLDQQKQLLLAILEAQEEERRRISESLHNGVGQILYATKLNLERVGRLLSPPTGPQWEALATTESLLAEAITETRNVSHELVPVLLKDFGLKTALDELCRKYQGSSLKLQCQITGLSGRLESHLELSLYRISQELITNTVKHAKATEANLLLEKPGEHLLLRVQDNGKGFVYQEGQTKGLGLRAIADRVKLLNGTLSVTAVPKGKGTRITIRIPA